MVDDIQVITQVQHELKKEICKDKNRVAKLQDYHLRKQDPEFKQRIKYTTLLYKHNMQTVYKAFKQGLLVPKDKTVQLDTVATWKDLKCRLETESEQLKMVNKTVDPIELNETLEKLKQMLIVK